MFFNWNRKKVTALVGFGSCCVLPPFHQYLSPVTDVRSQTERANMISQFYHKGQTTTDILGIVNPIILCEKVRDRQNRLAANLERRIRGIIKWGGTRHGSHKEQPRPVSIPGR